MKTELIGFRADNPPEDNTIIVGLFKKYDKYYVETCFYEEGTWKVKDQEGIYYTQRPILWTSLEDFLSTQILIEQKKKEQETEELLKTVRAILNNLFKEPGSESITDLNYWIKSSEKIKKETISFFGEFERKLQKELNFFQLKELN
jgi:hypothetical protein